MTVKALFPTSRPSLDLNFAKTKRLDPRITFSRSSTATYTGSNGLIKSAAVNEARFDHDPATGESLGLLVEEARTNLMDYSEQFDNANWTKTNLTVTANNAVAPDGTTTADTITATANNADIYNSTPTSNVIHINSIWIKRRTGTGQILLRSPQGQTNVDITSQVTSQWKRISSSATLPFASGILTFAGVQIIVSGDAVDIWGCQSEIGSFPTSYIPTTTATVTRAADLPSVAGANFSGWYNNSTGTVHVSGRGLLPTGYADNPGPFTFTDSVNSGYANRIGLMFDRGAYSRVTLMLWDPSGGSAQDVAFTGIAEPLPGQKYSIAVAMQSANSSCASGGIVVANNASFLGTYVPSNIARLGIGEGTYAASGRYSGTIARLTYYPARLSDATLQALTAS